MHELIGFTGATILAGDELRVQRDAVLLVQAGRIVEIAQSLPEGTREIDLRGKLLCPMFINAHSHLGDTGAKELGVGLPVEQAVVPPDGLKHRFLSEVQGTQTHIQMMRHGLLEMLHNGIIAMADFREQGLDGVRSLRAAAQGLPLRVIALGRMSETADCQQAELEARALLEEADGLGIRDVEAYPPAVLECLRTAYPQKIFAAHAAEVYASEMSSRAAHAGLGQAARLAHWHPDFLVHLVHTATQELQLLAAQGVRAVACPRCNGILGSGLPRLGDWARAGLAFGLGTDNVMFNSPDMFREMDYASRMVRGLERDSAILEPRRLLQAATIEGARALRLDTQLGSLAPGKDASWIAFDLNSANLQYQQDAISAVVHRATPADIASITIQGALWNE